MSPLAGGGGGLRGIIYNAASSLRVRADPTTDRVITGTARINGVDGFTYMVQVSDIAEPGRGVDKFSIELSTGYVAGFTYGDGPIAGGNIQLHKANASNTPPPDFTCQQ